MSHYQKCADFLRALIRSVSPCAIESLWNVTMATLHEETVSIDNTSTKVKASKGRLTARKRIVGAVESTTPVEIGVMATIKE